MAEQKLTPEQSLRVIETMIERTREGISVKSHYFLVWGWITFIACTGQFILKHFLDYPRHYLVWWLIAIGVVYSFVMGFKEAKTEKVRSYVSDSMKSLWTGMGITYFVLSIILTKLGWQTTVFPFFIILYALGTFISGSFLKFKPLIVGGVLAWALAILSVFVAYDYQIMMAALAILVSYIIPAYILRNQRRLSV